MMFIPGDQILYRSRVLGKTFTGTVVTEEDLLALSDRNPQKFSAYSVPIRLHEPDLGRFPAFFASQDRLQRAPREAHVVGNELTWKDDLL